MSFEKRNYFTTEYYQTKKSKKIPSETNQLDIRYLSRNGLF
jgi:hypothetical protein